MLQGFEGVISSPHGTAYQDFQGFPAAWNLAGKTGTASNQAGQEPNSWFVAFGPNPNPQYLVLAVIDQGGYGADAAAPLVRNIFDYIAANQTQISCARQDAHAGQPAEPDRPADQRRRSGRPTTTTDHHADQPGTPATRPPRPPARRRAGG